MNVFLQPYIDRGLLTELLPDNPSPERKLSLLYAPRHLSHKVRVFTGWLETCCERSLKGKRLKSLAN